MRLITGVNEYVCLEDEIILDRTIQQTMILKKTASGKDDSIFMHKMMRSGMSNNNMNDESLLEDNFFKKIST